MNNMNMNSAADRERLYGYVEAKIKRWWMTELARVTKLEGLSPKNGIGVLMTRVAEYGIKLDLGSLRDEPAVLTHKPMRRVRALKAS